ncbi:MAG TPA: CcdB family protein [Rhizomicrobium sp.]
MTQFDVFENPDPESAEAHPYFVILQADRLKELNTRIVAPLVAPKSLPGFERLMPTVSVKSKKLVIDVTNVGVFPVKLIPKPVANLERERYRIVGAIDLIFTGI